MSIVEDLKDKVLKGHRIIKDEALLLSQMDTRELSKAANEIRMYFCGDAFDMCTIVNGKSGRCREDCKFCAQSSFYNTETPEYSLMEKYKILNEAEYNFNKGVLRFSIVTSGRRLSKGDVQKVCEAVKLIKEKMPIRVCTSHGLLDEEDFMNLKAAGVSRIHNNLESSPEYFKSVCTTHTMEDKINAIKAASKVGLQVCSGGIVGMGETVEDRIDLAMKLREIGVRSIPVNMLNPIKGTPYENIKPLTIDEMCKTVALIRFIIPDGAIRLAGGRGLLEDKGRRCFISGANAAITGDMLTTSGTTIESDIKMVKELGYKIKEIN